MMNFQVNNECALLSQVLFLGPLIQLAMDCPWGFIDGIKVAVGEEHKCFAH